MLNSDRRSGRRGLLFFFRRPVIRLMVIFLAVFFLADALLFRVLLWRLPEESAWGEAPHFHFERSLREAERSAGSQAGPLLVVAGSSLALYSTLPVDLENDLRSRLKRDWRVLVLAHQGMTPVHLELYLDRILALKPALVVLPTNHVDYRLEQPILNEQMAALYDGDARARNAAIDSLWRGMLSVRELRELAPWPLVRRQCFRLGLQTCSQALMAGLSGAYRYRFLARNHISQLLENRFSSGRSYHSFAGGEIGGEGVGERGWSGRRFTVAVTEHMLSDGLRLEAPSQLHEGFPPPALQISASRGGQVLALWQHRLAQGWNRIELPAEIAPGDRLDVTVNRGWHSLDCACEVGVRLTRNAGLERASSRPRQRSLRREDIIYLQLNDLEYRASFAERLLRFDRVGMQYLHSLKISKETWAVRGFDRELPAAAAFGRIRQRLASAGVRSVVVNSPENPISLDWYGDSSWYRGWLQFLACPASEQGGCLFLDYSRMLPMQKFYDHHHLSYFGARDFTARLAEAIIQWESGQHGGPGQQSPALEQ